MFTKIFFIFFFFWLMSKTGTKITVFKAEKGIIGVGS